jgi:hypothetical protein
MRDRKFSRRFSVPQTTISPPIPGIIMSQNLPKIIAIFQEQNPLGRPGHDVPGEPQSRE